jgi:hypothetical protein
MIPSHDQRGQFQEITALRCMHSPEECSGSLPHFCTLKAALALGPALLGPLSVAAAPMRTHVQPIVVVLSVSASSVGTSGVVQLEICCQVRL